MKKLFFLFALSSITIFSSCSNDDDAVKNSNNITFDGKTVPISSAIIEDFKGIFDNTYYNYDFLFTGILDGKEYFVDLVLLSPIEGGNISFTTGTFNYSSSRPSEPRLYLEAGGLEIDQKEEFSLKSGKVTVSGSDTNYNVTATITLENDKILTLKYDGKLKVVDAVNN
jgi:hypothetical protein